MSFEASEDLITILSLYTLFSLQLPFPSNKDSAFVIFVLINDENRKNIKVKEVVLLLRVDNLKPIKYYRL